MIYRYRVDCWVPPKSGFDLADFHVATKRIQEALKVLFGQNDRVMAALKNFSKGHEGYIVESLVIESDKPYEDNIEEIKEGIQERFPGAEIISHQILEAVFVED